MRKNSVFSVDFNKNYAYEFISDKAREKYLTIGFTADFFKRAEYLIFGLPTNCIEGIIVGNIVANNTEYLSRLKELFPYCYISNLEGIVIA